MDHWTFQYLRKKYPYIYPEEKKFWAPLYILQDWAPEIGPHDHEFYEIAIVHYGSAEHTHFPPGTEKKRKNIVSAGDVFGLMPGQRHALHRISEERKQFNILFSPAFLGNDWEYLIQLPGLKALFLEQKILHLPPGVFEEIISAILYLQQEIFRRSTGYELNLKGLLLDLLLQIGRSAPRTREEKNNVYTDRAIQYIRKHMAEKITLEDIADHAGINKTYLCHIFQKKQGMPLWDCLNQIRIERAKFYLQTTSDPRIGEIASLCGFENNSYFAKIFRKFEGVSPRMYLKRLS